MDSLGLKHETILHNLGVRCADIQSDKPKQLIQCVENWLFVFNPDNSSVVVTNLSQEPITYQTLVPSPVPTFQVTSILINPTLTYCALVGTTGLSIMNLPNTKGIGGQFDCGKENIICKSVKFDERHFVCNPSLYITQVRWHPHSPGDNLLLLLTSANDLRFYCAKTSRSGSRRIDATSAPVATLTSLGHMTVDFQFLPPQFKEDTPEEELEFPILVLFQDGEVHMVHMVVSQDDLVFAPTSGGSLPFLPYSSENYAEDASSLLVLPSSPPVVSIATSTGILYHCLLLPNDTQEDETWQGVGSSIQRGPYSLHVTEVVELKLGGFGDEDESRMFCNNIRLYPDVGNISRYFCFHKSGVHTVRVPLVEQLKTLAEAEEDWTSLLHTLLSIPCQTEHLLYIGTTEEMPDHLGFAVCHLPRALILLLGNGEFVSCTLHSKVMEKGEALIDGLNETLNVSDTAKPESYVNYVASILSASGNIPLLKVDPNASFTDEDIRDIYSKSMESLLKQTLPQLDLAALNMIEKVAALKKKEMEIMQQIDEYVKVQAQCKESAERLAEKYEDMNEKHEDLMAKCQHVLMNMYTKTNTDPSEEAYFRDKLQAYHSRVEDLNQQLVEIRNIEQQAKTINQEEINSPAGLHLNPNKERVLKEVLNELQTSIQNLILDVNQTQNDVETLNRKKQRG